MTSEQARRELAAFLRSRRQRVDPRTHGLHPGRRRTPGLRREEVAAVAGVSLSWYAWLEQGRDIRASREVLESVGRALRLDAAETEYLLRLGGHVPAPTGSHGDAPHSDTMLQALVDGFLPNPASVITPSFDFVVWNRASELIAPGFLSGCGDRGHNLLRYHFCGPTSEREDGLESLVARLRANAARHPGDHGIAAVTQELNETSPGFARLWQLHEVGPCGALPRIRKSHPDLGDLVLEQVHLTPQAHPDLTMVVSLPADDATAITLDALQGR